MSDEKCENDKMEETHPGDINKNKFEEDRLIEQLLISNDDLSIECEELKKKLKETNSSLAVLEEKIENLTVEKLRETEKGNSLAAQLEISEANVLHFKQLARVEIRKVMSETSASSVHSGSFRLNTSLGLESSSVRSDSIRNNSNQELVSVVAKMKQKMRQTSEKEPDQSQDGSFRQNTSVGLESSSLRSGSFRNNASLAGSYKQNTLENSSLRTAATTGSFSHNAALGLESSGAKKKQKLRQTSEKEKSPPPSTEKQSPKPSELKVNPENLVSTSATEVHDPLFKYPLFPTVLIQEKVNSDQEVSKIVSEDVIFKRSINFDEMDDDEFCQYQLKLMLAKENQNENPEELEADIEEVTKLFNLSGHLKNVQESVSVPSRPCSVKFLSRGWGMTLTKARAYFTSFHGVTGVKVDDAIVVVTFNTLEDALAVIDKHPHVVSGCQLVPGPVTLLEDDDGVAEDSNVEDELGNRIVPASQRTVEFFMTGEDINEEFFKSMPGVESFSVDGKRVRLVYKELKMSEDVLNKGFVEKDGQKITVGREGQLGWVEIKVARANGDKNRAGGKGDENRAGGKGQIKVAEDKAVVDLKRLAYLLQDAGLSPVLDIQASARGGGIFGIVLENAKARKLIKKGKLRLGSGFFIEVMGEEKQLKLDLGEGEELAGKMIMSSDTEGSSVLSQLKSIREKKDLNHNIIEDASDMLELNDEKLKHCEAANLSLGCSNTGSADEELKTNKAANLSLGCSSTGSVDEELRPNKAANLSLGCSSNGSDDEEDCIQKSEQSVNKSIVQVIRIKLAPRSGLKCEEKTASLAPRSGLKCEGKTSIQGRNQGEHSESGQDLEEPSQSDQNLKEVTVEDEAGYRSLNWSSCGSLNDSVEDEDSEDSVDEGGNSDTVVGNNSVEVVRIVLTPSNHK